MAGNIVRDLEGHESWRALGSRDGRPREEMPGLALVTTKGVAVQMPLLALLA